jgi:F-type H+-transporting ATPase subunit b
MPQLDFSTFPSQLFWLTITFAVLYLLMAKLILPRIESVIGARQSRMDGDLERASRMQSEAEAVMAAYEKALATAREKAQATMKETTDRLNAIAAERQAQASALIGKRLEEAERRIAEEKGRAMASLRELATEVTQASVSRLIGAPVDTARAGQAVETVLKERGL